MLLGSRGGWGGGGGLSRGPQRGLRAHVRAHQVSAPAWMLDPRPQLEQLAHQPTAQDLPREQPRASNLPIVRLQFDSIPVEDGGPYDSPQRREFEEQLLHKVIEHPEYGYNPNTPNAHSCIRAYQFHRLGSRNGHADISLARHSPAARQLAEKWVREGAVVEEFTLHARYAPSLRPVGTVRVLICDLPAGYEVQGITETLLTCAGYENASTLVVSEFLGTGVLASREVKSVGRSDFIVAFVDAPAGDQKLQLLPDHLFLENGKRVFIGVEGRDPQQRGFIPVGTPSPPPPPPPPARPYVASGPPAGIRTREDPARGGAARERDTSNGTSAMQVDPRPTPFPLIPPAEFQALVQQGEALTRLADRPPSTWGPQEQYWGMLAALRVPSAMDIDSTGTTPETAPRASTPPAQQQQQQSVQPTLPQQQQQQQAQRQQQERLEQEHEQQRQQELHQAQQRLLEQQHLRRQQLQQQQQEQQQQQQQTQQPPRRPQSGQQQQQQQQHRREQRQPPPPRQQHSQRQRQQQHSPSRAEAAWEAWKKGQMYDNMAHALDEYELQAEETKEAVIREFYAFLGSSPLARGNQQGGSGAGGTAALPRFAVLWLDERYKTGGYGSDTSSGGLQSTRKSTRARRAPDPERLYGSRSTSSPRGGPA